VRSADALRRPFSSPWCIVRIVIEITMQAEKHLKKSKINQYLSILKNEMKAIRVENGHGNITIENILLVYLLTIQNMYYFSRENRDSLSY
jgi:hypothetical protein